MEGLLGAEKPDERLRCLLRVARLLSATNDRMNQLLPLVGSGKASRDEAWECYHLLAVVYNQFAQAQCYLAKHPVGTVARELADHLSRHQQNAAWMALNDIDPSTVPGVFVMKIDKESP